MHYGLRDVERMLRLPRSTIRALIEAGFVAPARGPRNALQFSFQDLIVLRTAQSLAAAKVPAKRITSSLKELRRQLPDSMPLSGLSIGAVGDAVVVRDGATQRQADSGQYLLTFEGDPRSGSLSVIEKKSPPPAPAVSDEANDWFDEGLELEQGDAPGAIKAYQRAIAGNPRLLDAHINLGRLLHEARRFADAEKAYRRGMDACGGDALLLYNLGVLLDDLDRKPEAIAAYESALRADPSMADCHYNLALLCEKAGQSREAIRHMSQYRRLTATTAR